MPPASDPSRMVAAAGRGAKGPAVTPDELAAIQARADHLAGSYIPARRGPTVAELRADAAMAQQVVAEDVPALIAEVRRAQQAETHFHATLAADGFIAITQTQHAEYERLRTEVRTRGEFGILAGGEWRAERGWIVDGKFQTWLSYITHRPCAPTHERRIWTGPIETVQEQP